MSDDKKQENNNQKIPSPPQYVEYVKKSKDPTPNQQKR
ncbi:hypothetical protein RHSA111115_01885 [Rheinheimera salexigens]